MAASVAWDTDAAGNNLVFALNDNVANTITYGFSTNQGALSTQTVTGHTGSASIGVAAWESSKVNVTYCDGTTIRTFSFQPQTLVVIDAVATVEAFNAKALAGVATSLTTVSWYYWHSDATAWKDYIKRVVVTSGTAGTPAIFARSVSIFSRPWLQNGLEYIPTAYSSTLQGAYMVLDQTGAVVARLLSGSGGVRHGANDVASIARISDNKILLALSEQVTAFATNDVNLQFLSGVTAVELEFFNSQRSYSVAELAGVLHVSGGLLSMYDGVSLVEHGFNVFPEASSAVTSAGGSVNDGAHSYVVVYEWKDATGARHQSAPSPAVSATTGGGNNTVTLTIPTLRLTAKAPVNVAGAALAYPRANVSLAVYRTEAAGTEYFRVSSLTSLTYNDVTNDTVTYVDTASDATLVAGEPLYTFGGVLEDVAAPACHGLTVHKNRLFLVNSERPLEVWYSKQVVPGQPVEMSDAAVMNVDPVGGLSINEMESMDANLIIGKEGTLSYVGGDGPSDTGANNDFGTPQLITSDVGISEPRSVCRTPVGLMFKSTKGIYMLGRDLAVTYVGADVESFNSETVVSCTLVRDVNQVRVGLGDSGSALVYDYYVQQWSVFTYRNLVDACIWQNKYTFVQSNGRAMVEDASVFTDAGLFYPLKATTAWMAVAGVSGMQRAYRLMLLGDFKSPHSLKFSVAYDFNDAPTQVKSVDASSLATGVWGDDTAWGATSPWGGSFPAYQWRLDLTRQKCTAVQFSFEDVQTSNFGEGMTLSNMALQVGVIGTIKQVPASKIVGGSDA
jgi:hypothetical protein